MDWIPTGNKQVLMLTLWTARQSSFFISCPQVVPCALQARKFALEKAYKHADMEAKQLQQKQTNVEIFIGKSNHLSQNTNLAHNNERDVKKYRTPSK